MVPKVASFIPGFKQPWCMHHHCMPASLHRSPQRVFTLVHTVKGTLCMCAVWPAQGRTDDDGPLEGARHEDPGQHEPRHAQPHAAALQLPPDALVVRARRRQVGHGRAAGADLADLAGVVDHVREHLRMRSAPLMSGQKAHACQCGACEGGPAAVHLPGLFFDLMTKPTRRR